MDTDEFCDRALMDKEMADDLKEIEKKEKEKFRKEGELKAWREIRDKLGDKKDIEVWNRKRWTFLLIFVNEKIKGLE